LININDRIVRKVNNSRFYINLPIILAIGMSAGIFIGARMVDSGSRPTDILSSIYKFREVITHVERDYVDKVEVSELVESAIERMLEKLDPHTVYIPAKDASLAKSQLDGGFEGIGIEFNILRDTIYVVAPISGGPSEQVGLLSGDKIIKINNETVAGTGITNRNVIDLLRGKKGSKVDLAVKRRGAEELLNFTITRDRIPQHSVDISYMIDHEIGYIKISRFAATTYDEFKEAFGKLKDQGMQKLILDLQGNPGGYMDRAISIVDEFLPADQLIVYTEGKRERYASRAVSTARGSFLNNPLIVLIDEGSASASEIVAGALQDNDRALVVGRRSFGKGLVQMPISLSDGSELRLTISRYFTPSGRSIQRPYENGVREYHQDQIERFQHGEYFHSDSIKFNDTLEFKTNKGRIVYGGGGIMPDYFVPLDTSMNSEYLRNLFFNNTLREYTLRYYENHREKLHKMSFDDFRNNFTVTDQMLKELVQMGEASGTPFNKEQFERSKEMLKLRIKAQIARSVWQEQGFYPIVNEANEVFQQALKLFDEASELAAN
jgi:carboxyl-terminal processing protease